MEEFKIALAEAVRELDKETAESIFEILVARAQDQNCETLKDFVYKKSQEKLISQHVASIIFDIIDGFSREEVY